MMKFLLIALPFTACNLKRDVADIPIEKITVKMGSSYKIDLENAAYTVYFFNGSSYDCKFTLSDQDKKDILKMANGLGLTQLKGNIQVEDNCQFFPKVFTQLSFYAGSNPVHISIDAGCDKHSILKRQHASGIIDFLAFLHKRIFSKPEVLRAPQTDISYH